MKRKIYVHIADDHKIVIEGIIAVLNTDDTIHVNGYSQTGQQAIDFIKLNPTDVLVLDISMPDVSGIDVLNYFNEHNIEQNTIILSSYDDIGFVDEMIKLGAKGYVSKSSAGEHIVAAIKNVAEGKNYFSEDIQSNMIKKMYGEEVESGDRPVGSFNSEDLTERELEVLILIAKEYSAAEIADKINISESTVKTYKQRLFTKLNVKNSVGLGMFAVKHKLI